MAVTFLNSSTVSVALTKVTSDFTVGSTSNIAVGNLLAIMSTSTLEFVKVQAIPVAGRVQVIRGVQGTKARAVASGAKFFIGDPDDFQQLRQTAAGLFGDSGALPEFVLPGSRARDGAGNEYVMVDSTTTLTPGATVTISRDGNYTCAALTGTSQGSVGVIMEEATSDQFVWAQIYGNCRVKLVSGSSLVSSLGEFQGATSTSTPLVGLLGRSSSQRSSAYLEASVVVGMWPTGAAADTTLTTSATSETGLSTTAWLHYPYILRPITT